MEYDGLVLTGDINGYTKLKLENREALMNSIAELLHSWVAEPEHSRVFRGDSIQALFKNADDCLRRAIQLRCWLKKDVLGANEELDARLVIGIGKIDIYGETVLESDGEAFHLSGRAFDVLQSDEYLRIVTREATLNRQFDVICRLMDIQIRNWTRAQAEVIYMALENKTQQAMADELGVAQSAINNRLKLAKWKEIEGTINYLSSLLQH